MKTFVLSLLATLFFAAVGTWPQFFHDLFSLFL